MIKIPDLPSGWRLITQEEKDSIRGLSSYLTVYPKILHNVRAYDEKYGWKEAGAYKYLWDDIYYAIPAARVN